MIYTLGYQGLTVEQVAAWLNKHDAIAIDVRLRAWAQAPEWTKPKLIARLGRRYRHVNAFGNDHYKQPALGIKLHDPEAGVAQVRGLERMVLLCACWSWAHCHRRVVAELLRERLGEDVHHLARAEITGETPRPVPPPPDQLGLI